MKRVLIIYGLLVSGLLCCSLPCFSQLPVLAPRTTASAATDTMLTVEILPGVNKLELRKLNDSTQLQILTGNVQLRQGKTLFYCDSCVINNRANTFEAWGNVHINDADTTDVYSNHLIYYGNRKYAYLDGNVRLTDGQGTLTTPDLEYDVETKIGIYKRGGKVVNKQTTLTSREGWYYTDLKDVYFKGNVELKDPVYYLKSDSLLYNTELETARFIAQTFIRDSSGRTIDTKDGFYNLKTGKAEFGRRPVINDGPRRITGDKVAIDDSTGISQAIGNAIVVDTAQGTTIIAGEIFRNNKTDAILATRKPLMIIKQDNDSIYISADTLFSARLSDLQARIEAAKKADSAAVKDSLPTVPGTVNDSLSTDIFQESSNDSLKKKEAVVPTDSVIVAKTPPKTVVTEQKATTADSLMIKESPVAGSHSPADNGLKKDTLVKDTIKGTAILDLDKNDSTNRYFEAYHNVRIFSDSLQGICDSLFYSFKDSIFRMYQDPVVWAKESQVTGDTILLFTKNKKADRMEVIENSFMVNMTDPEIYNQVKSLRMEGWFVDGNIDSVRAKGMAECIYYIQDEDSAYTGVNESKADIIDIYFKEKELTKVVFRSAVTGTMWPMSHKTPSEMRLPDFRWLDDRRPKTRYELFE